MIGIELRAEERELRSRGFAAKSCMQLVIYILRKSVSKCPLREGGSPKGGGWIRLEEAGSAKQRDSAKAESGFERRK
jgi:hypothetical protein